MTQDNNGTGVGAGNSVDDAPSLNLAVQAGKLAQDLQVAADDKRLKKKIPIMEVFGPTIQGEGFLIGNPTFFIRTGLCDYKCDRCDSLHAVLPESVRKNGMWITQLELVALVDNAMHNIPTPMITLSGGNPALHDLSLFFDANDRGMIGSNRRGIAIETQGTLWQDWILRCNFVTISPKGPGMEEKAVGRFEGDKFDNFVKQLAIRPDIHWCVKVPVFDQRDIELIVSIMEYWPITRQRMYISVGNDLPPEPAHRKTPKDTSVNLDEFRDNAMANYKRVLDLIYNDPRMVGVSILPQLHTLIWGNEACR